MLFACLSITAAATEPTVVAVSADLVVDAPAGAATRAWLPVLSDCLEEAAGAPVSIVDRSGDVAGVPALLDAVGALRALDPAVVVLGLAPPAARDGASGDKVAAAAERIVGALRADGGPRVVLIGSVAPTLAQLPASEPALPERQQLLDARVDAWTASLRGLAAVDAHVTFVDLWTGWPRQDTARAELTREAYTLSDPAHARIGAAICEAVLPGITPAQD